MLFNASAASQPTAIASTLRDSLHLLLLVLQTVSAFCSGLALLLASLGAQAVTEYGTSGGCEDTLLMPTLGIAQQCPWSYPLRTLPYQSCDSLCPGLWQFKDISVVAVASEHSSGQLLRTAAFHRLHPYVPAKRVPGVGTAADQVHRDMSGLALHRHCQAVVQSCGCHKCQLAHSRHADTSICHSHITTYTPVCTPHAWDSTGTASHTYG